MYCSGCGTALAAGVRFCASCGAAAGAPAAPAAQVAAPPPPAAPAAVPPPSVPAGGPGIRLSLQGVDRSLRANGSYDPIEYGVVSPQQFAQILEYLKPQVPPPGDDCCWPSAVAEGPGGSFTMTACNGEISVGDAGTPYTAEEIVRAVSGAAPKKAAAPPRGWNPVRHPQIPPTDADGVDPKTINTSLQSPQVSFVAWGESGIKALFWFGMIPAAICALLIFASFNPLAPGLLAGAFLGLVVSILLIYIGWTKGRVTFRMGVDWATNTLWVDNQEKIRYIVNATCITGFQLEEVTSYRQTTVNKVPVKVKRINYKLRAVRTSEIPVLVSGLPTMSGRESRRALEAAQRLLQMMG